MSPQKQKQKQVPHSFQKPAFLMEMCALAFLCRLVFQLPFLLTGQNVLSIHAAYGKQLLIYS
ncbi:hypothetical protein [Faecalibacterium sp. 9]|uniref:hypothetical protein n=1 Tax=Faecalibacterium sp. 9 TaxID=3402018 RepID=UPI003AAA5617